MPTIHSVTQYNYQFHGGASGYQGNRAVLRLKNGNTSVAYVYFKPEGITLPSDTNTGSWIKMYLPESLIPAVMETLRNESPISVYYASGSGFLITGNEPVGEEES